MLTSQTLPPEIPSFRKEYLDYSPVISKYGISENLQQLKTKCDLDSIHERAWLLKAVTLIDLTCLASDATQATINELCVKAVHPLGKELLDSLVNQGLQITTAAVCVYPSRVKDAVNHLNLLGSEMPVASVATGFPSGQFPLCTRLEEIKFCVANGAKEIDIVLDRSLVITEKWDALYEEVKAMKEACGDAHMKTILGTGECGSLENVFKASLVSMMAGSDFIKTSTGKESVNATLEVGLVMCRAIRLFESLTGRKVGLKPAGGLKTWKDAIEWLMLVHRELGPEWLTPSLFRIGASSLLADVVERLSFHCK